MFAIAHAPSDPRTGAVESLYALAYRLMAASRHRDAADVLRLMILARSADERGWVALGACHEACGEEGIARQIYETGRVVAEPAGRCEIALARIARRTGEEAIAEDAIARADECAEARGDSELRALVAWEKGAAP